MRRCVEKVTGNEYAVKIIDLTSEEDSEFQMEQIRTATRKEISILRLAAEHANISEYLGGGSVSECWGRGGGGGQ